MIHAWFKLDPRKEKTTNDIVVALEATCYGGQAHTIRDIRRTIIERLDFVKDTPPHMLGFKGKWVFDGTLQQNDSRKDSSRIGQVLSQRAAWTWNAYLFDPRGQHDVGPLPQKSRTYLGSLFTGMEKSSPEQRHLPLFALRLFRDGLKRTNNAKSTIGKTINSIELNIVGHADNLDDRLFTRRSSLQLGPGGKVMRDFQCPQFAKDGLQKTHEFEMTCPTSLTQEQITHRAHQHFAAQVQSFVPGARPFWLEVITATGNRGEKVERMRVDGPI